MTAHLVMPPPAENFPTYGAGGIPAPVKVKE